MKHYFIFEAPLDLDLLGIDRVLVNRKTGVATTVEFKNDSRAADTGRAYIEIRGNVEFNTDGWIHSCKAQKILIAVPPTGQIFICDTAKMRAKLPAWLKEYGTRQAFNLRYKSEGVCVPLSVLATLADAVVVVKPQDQHTAA